MAGTSTDGPGDVDSWPGTSTDGRGRRLMAEVRPHGGPFRIGLLGHGTVGSAFDELLAQRADRIEAITGLRPVLAGVLTRSGGGDFESLLRDSDLIVELIGGLEPAR